jgi:hypothetical protein
MKVDRSDPLTFFMSVMRNPDAPYEEVKAAARELLPYTRPKLSSVEARIGGKTHEDRLEELERMAAEAGAESEGRAGDE